MNVLQLVPKLNIGGVEKGTLEVARYLSLNDHKAVVVSGGGRLEAKLAGVGAVHYSLPVGRKDPFSMFYCYFKLKEIIRKEQIDIIHARSRIPAITGYFAARSAKKVFLTTAHGQYKRHLISHVMGWGKYVIVASSVMAQHMRDNFGVPPRKLVMIPRGVDLERFSFIAPSEKKNETLRIGMISRITPLKGHLDFLKAVSLVYRKYDRIEVVIMGDRNSARPEYLRKLDLAVRHLMVDKIVEFKGAEEDVPAVLSTLDILVSANREQEAFGRTIIEAQARGVPVVATRVGGIIETIEDEVSGLLCEPGDPEDMAEKIMRFVSGPDLREKIAKNARKSVEEQFSLERMLSLTLDTYKKACATKNILVLKISSFGDVILIVPSLRALRARFPNALIKVLVDVRFRKVLEACPYIDEVLTCDFANRDNGPGFVKLASTLRSEDIDISIDFQNNRRSHLLAFLAGARERFGFDNRKFAFFLNRKAALPKAPMDPVDHQERLLSLLGVKIASKELELWPDEASRDWVDKFMESSWVKKDEKLVAMAVSASRNWKTKNWEPASFRALADNMAREKGIRVVLIGSEEDAPAAEEFLKKHEFKPVNAVGKTNITQLIALIDRADALVSGDSAPIHIAAALRKPFVALFGPTDPKRHMPPSSKGKYIFKGVDCSPCYKGECLKNGHKCMTSIRQKEVYDALERAMA